MSRSSPRSSASANRAPISAPRRWTRPRTRSLPPPVAVSATGVRAVERAGIDYSAIRRRRRWTRELVLSEIRELKVKGADLRSGEIRHQHPAPVRRRLQGPLLRKLDEGAASRRRARHAGCDHARRDRHGSLSLRSRRRQAVVATKGHDSFSRVMPFCFARY